MVRAEPRPSPPSKADDHRRAPVAVRPAWRRRCPPRRGASPRHRPPRPGHRPPPAAAAALAAVQTSSWIRWRSRLTSSISIACRRASSSSSTQQQVQRPLGLAQPARGIQPGRQPEADGRGVDGELPGPARRSRPAPAARAGGGPSARAARRRPGCGCPRPAGTMVGDGAQGHQVQQRRGGRRTPPAGWLRSRRRVRRAAAR